MTHDNIQRIQQNSQCINFYERIFMPSQSEINVEGLGNIHYFFLKYLFHLSLVEPLLE